ncbi:Hypothetical predicted protein [Podarcis lilfordi]|uniref:Uncharacterized protein n=1 Tax=Podarcis lilfordi TaxID=74358 RepID=A0AA35P145_9SAUR|nr:Hypothetical predicted protein [Podarcis lilfordi]
MTQREERRRDQGFPQAIRDSSTHFSPLLVQEDKRSLFAVTPGNWVVCKSLEWINPFCITFYGKAHLSFGTDFRNGLSLRTKLTSNKKVSFKSARTILVFESILSPSSCYEIVGGHSRRHRDFSK